MDFKNRFDVIRCNNSRKRPMMVSWDITNRCNMNCLHCFNNSGDNAVHAFETELTEEEAINVARQICELRPDQCCICGGEPLLSPHLFKIIKILIEGGIITNLVTNGFLMSVENATRLKEIGIHHIQISIDGLGIVHDCFRNTPNAFSRAIEAFKTLCRVGIVPAISFCPNITNHLQIREYVKYMDTLGCKSIRMMPLLPLGRGEKHSQDLSLNSDQLFEFVQTIKELQKLYPEVDIEWGDPLEHLALVLNTRRKYPIVMSIKSNGDLSITPYIPIVVGNVREKTLRTYWENGYNTIWSDERVIEIIRRVKSIYDLPTVNERQIELSL